MTYTLATYQTSPRSMVAQLIQDTNLLPKGPRFKSYPCSQKNGTWTLFLMSFNTLCKAIHVQWSFREIVCALNKFWLVESWFLDTRSSGSRYIVQWNNFRPIRIQDTRCLLASDWSKIIHHAMDLLPLDLVSKNQLSTNQNLFNAHANLRNDRWTCIIPLDMYCLTSCVQEWY